MHYRAPQSTKMFSKKSQMQMQETIAVLAAVFIIAILGLSLYYNIFINAAKDEQTNNFDNEAIGIAQSIPFLPELQCSSNGIAANNCIDALKLKAAASLMNSSEYRAFYFEKFGFAAISINEIYPGTAHLNLYNRTPESYSYKSAINLPVLLFYQLDGKYSFGVVSFEAFLK